MYVNSYGMFNLSLGKILKSQRMVSADTLSRPDKPRGLLEGSGLKKEAVSHCLIS